MRKTRALISFVPFIVAAAAGAWVFFFWLAPRTSGRLRHEVYVWQRAWTEPVRNAVEQHGTNFSALAVLKAEVSWKDKKPQVTRVPVDYVTLAKSQRPVGIALRIGPYAGPFVGAPGSTRRVPLILRITPGRRPALPRHPAKRSPCFFATWLRRSWRRPGRTTST
ncbi:MAG: hypothetical protein V9H26_24350 [Verrucomicrobiota bacterium]